MLKLLVMPIVILVLIAFGASIFNQKINNASKLYQICIAILLEFIVLIILYSNDN